jgi:hypothetical protein
MLDRDNISSQINDILVEKFQDLALDEHGSFVLQKYLKFCQDEVIIRLKPKIISLSTELSTNPNFSKPVQIYFMRLDKQQVNFQ